MHPLRLALLAVSLTVSLLTVAGSPSAAAAMLAAALVLGLLPRRWVRRALRHR
ncbi:MAG: hypothetical protein ACM3ZA_05520 [Bacillota bacterium]